MNNFYLQTERVNYRPVSLQDAEFIVMLRNLPHAKKMIHGTSAEVEKQKEWIRDYLQRENEYYWIIESKDGKPVGTISLYHFDPINNQIESGRWVQLPGFSDSISLSGDVLFKDFAFNVLKVSRIVSDTACFNKQVIKYHKFLGERIFDRVKDDVEINGEKVEVVWFEEDSTHWPDNRKKLLKFCGNESDRKAFRIEPDGTLTEIELYSK